MVFLGGCRLPDPPQSGGQAPQTPRARGGGQDRTKKKTFMYACAIKKLLIPYVIVKLKLSNEANPCHDL